MITKFIEATDATEFNWGKFAVCRFTDEEWARRSEIGGRRMLNERGWGPEHLLVLDLQTGEGSIFLPRGYARVDLNEKHKIWVCPMFEPFLTWLYKQDLSDLDKLPTVVNLGAVATSMQGHRRTRGGRE